MFVLIQHGIPVMSLKQILKQLRKNIKNRLKSSVKADLKNNHITLPRGGIVRLEIKGRNNTVIFPEHLDPSSIIQINIRGDNNMVRIDSTDHLVLKIKIGDSDSTSNNCTIAVGEKTSCWDTFIFLFEHNSSVTIGNDCMISWNVLIWCTDMHAVTALDGCPTNQGKSVIIGNNVWIGRDVHVAKNTQIPSHSVIGWCSNVTGKFTEPNVIIAGNPAQIVKRGVDWRHERYDDIAAEYAARTVCPDSLPAAKLP